RSAERILTTHVGSLVRPAELVEALRAEQLGQDYNVAEFERSLAPAVAEAVRQQVAAGIDIVDDGEYGKVAWTQYVVERLGGIEHRDADPTTMRGGALVSKDRQEFSAYYAVYDRVSSTMWLPPELADALREEDLAVIDAGFLLQVDDAFIPYNYERLLAQGLSMTEYRKHCQMRIEAVNYALRGIPEDRVRYHICWGSWAGPHTSD